MPKQLALDKPAKRMPKAVQARLSAPKYSPDEPIYIHSLLGRVSRSWLIENLSEDDLTLFEMAISHETPEGVVYFCVGRESTRLLRLPSVSEWFTNKCRNQTT